MRKLGPTLCLLGAAFVAACGGGSDNSSPPPPTFEPDPVAIENARQAASQRAAALRLYEIVEVHASMTASPFVYAAYDDKVSASGPCGDGSGSMQISLDGNSPEKGTVLPTGSHTLVVSFANCRVDGLAGQSLNGTATAAYTSTGPDDKSALLSASSMRGVGQLGFRTSLSDATAEGSGTWSRMRNGTMTTTTYAPAVGARLINNLTTNVATFGGGSYVSSDTRDPQSGWSATQTDYNNLTVDINGTEYVLNGSLRSAYLVGGDFFPEVVQQSHTGEVRITRGGTLLARIARDTNGVLFTEVLGPLVPF